MKPTVTEKWYYDVISRRFADSDAIIMILCYHSDTMTRLYINKHDQANRIWLNLDTPKIVIAYPTDLRRACCWWTTTTIVSNGTLLGRSIQMGLHRMLPLPRGVYCNQQDTLPLLSTVRTTVAWYRCTTPVLFCGHRRSPPLYGKRTVATLNKKGVAYR